MKPFITLMLNKLIYLLCIFSFAVNAQQVEPASQKPPIQQDRFDWSALKKVWQDDIQFHGFLSQGLFHTSGNNVYGQSKNSVSAGLTEVGLNMSYQALNNLSFAAQGLYRRAGASTGDAGEVTLDFAFIDLTFLNFQDGRVGIRGGRVKNPWGLYNETRDVAFTHPTILLPLTYFERSRTLFLSLDGGQLYADYNTPIGDFNFKLNYGIANVKSDELLGAITISPDVKGELTGEASLVTQLNYEVMDGKYIFAISYADINLGYEPGNASDPFAGLSSKFDSFIASAQYNGEKFSLAAEYSLIWNQITGITHIRPDSFPVSEYWYIQGGYRILDNLQLTLRYDSAATDINDRSGENFHNETHLPAHFQFTQDFVVGLRWDITPSWMIRAEYHRVHGASTVNLLDNPDIADLALDWNIFGLQAAFRF